VLQIAQRIVVFLKDVSEKLRRRIYIFIRRLRMSKYIIIPTDKIPENPYPKYYDDPESPEGRSEASFHKVFSGGQQSILKAGKEVDFAWLDKPDSEGWWWFTGKHKYMDFKIPPMALILNRYTAGKHKGELCATDWRDGTNTNDFIKEKDKLVFEDNVYLTQGEYEKLVAEFGEKPSREKIERLSLYMKSKGAKYKDHYATILTWERMGESRKSKGNGQRSGKFSVGKYAHMVQR
jgi:hypothetical protein